MEISIRRARLAIAVAVMAAGAGFTAQAQDTPIGGKDAVTRHHGVFNGRKVTYTATVGETIVTDDKGTPIASFYSTDYVARKAHAKNTRAVVFIWNGGPSAASETLQMAGFGPRRLVIPNDADAKDESPFDVRDNTHTVLDVADLVFVDPAETGFSRILPAGSRDYFYSAEGDAAAVTQFIKTWLSDHGRARSPVFIMGASYGSVRAAIMAGLFAASDVPLEGVILLSQGVNLVETTQRANSLIGYASNISQLAAIAWYHGRTGEQDRSVYDVLDDAYGFAMGDYLTAIAKGSDIPEAELERVARRLSDLIGIDTDYLESKTLLINKGDFRRRLLKDRGFALFPTDARRVYALDGGRPGNLVFEQIGKAERRHLVDFLKVTLPVDQYRSFAPDTGDWDYGGSSTLNGQPVARGAARSVFADFDWPGDLAKAFNAKPSFRLFIATGIYDTLTTSGPARLLASDVDFPGDRVERHEYEGGHSFYSNDAEFERLTGDIRKFIVRKEP